MAEQEDNKDPIARRLAAAASLLTELIGKDVMVQPDAGSRQNEAQEAAANEIKPADLRCR
jgi:hypothetical protein